MWEFKVLHSWEHKEKLFSRHFITFLVSFDIFCLALSFFTVILIWQKILFVQWLKNDCIRFFLFLVALLNPIHLHTISNHFVMKVKIQSTLRRLLYFEMKLDFTLKLTYFDFLLGYFGLGHFEVYCGLITYYWLNAAVEIPFILNPYLMWGQLCATCQQTKDSLKCSCSFR